VRAVEPKMNIDLTGLLADHIFVSALACQTQEFEACGNVDRHWQVVIIVAWLAGRLTGRLINHLIN
jgi:hypothetical protein